MDTIKSDYVDFTVIRRSDSSGLGLFSLYDIEVRDGRRFSDLTEKQTFQVMDDLIGSGLTNVLHR